MTRILMVCLGNICRSPLAEGILKAKVDPSTVYIDSAGTSAHHQGELPDHRSIAVAQLHNIDISNQRSRPFTVSDYQNFDIIYVMDKSNYNNVLKLATSNADEQKVKLILTEISRFPIQNVPDPYYDSENGFKNVYKMLDMACTEIAKKLD